MLGIVLATLLAFSPQTGTVYTADGGRVRGTVLDAGPGGVTVQLADGTTRKLDAAQVSRVDFADGTSWKPTPAPAAAPAAPASTIVPRTRPPSVVYTVPPCGEKARNVASTTASMTASGATGTA